MLHIFQQERNIYENLARVDIEVHKCGRFCLKLECRAFIGQGYVLASKLLTNNNFEMVNFHWKFTRFLDGTA